MSLFPDPTTAQIQVLVAADLIERGKNIRASIKGTCEYIYNQIWLNSNGLTPQQVCDAFGANAGLLWMNYNSLITYANTVQPGSITLMNPGTITINKDGTCTVSGLPDQWPPLAV